MKHSRFVIVFLIAMLCMGIIPALAQDYGSTTNTTPTVTETPTEPDWVLIETPAGYSIFGKTGYNFFTFATKGKGITVLWFSAADVENCDNVEAFRVTDSGSLASETGISKCSIEFGSKGKLGLRIELARTGLPAHVVVFKKLKSNKIVELQSGDA